MLEAHNQKLIATIYAATLSPQGFDELVEDLHSGVVQVLSAVTGLEDIEDVLPDSQNYTIGDETFPELARHIENALNIQIKIGHIDEIDERTALILELIPNPAVVFNSGEFIQRRNAQARQTAFGEFDTLGKLFPDPHQLAEIRKAVSSLRSGNEFASVPIRLDLQKSSNTCVFLKRIRGSNGGNDVDSLYLLTIAEFGFDNRVADLFRETYDLTSAETSVAILLASGAKPEEIAKRRSVKLDTIRTQIKAIKSKTKAPDLPNLVRLLCGFSSGILVPNRALQTASAELIAKFDPSAGMLMLSDGRRMDYLVQGDPGGKPVLLLHNMPYGAVLPAAAVQLARKRGLKIIAPFRPGHRDSDPLAIADREEYLDQVVRDMNELMVALSISKVKLLGNGGGSTYAIRFASTFPEKVSEILMITRAPVWKGEWLQEMPPRQKLVSMLLKFAPKMARLFVWAILSYINKQKLYDYARTSVGESPADLKAIENPEFMQLFSSGITAGLKQGGEAYCRDWELMEIDMTEEARKLPHKMHILHGADDRIVKPEFSRQFAKEVPGTTLEIVEGAGNFLFYSHWRHVMNAL